MRAAAVVLLVLGHLTLGYAWRCKEAPQLYRAKQIDAGQGQVVATNVQRYAFALNGRYWSRLPFTRVKHVTVGFGGTWAVDTKDSIYKLVGGNATVASGKLKQLDAGGNAFIVGANSRNQAFCLNQVYTVGYKGGSNLGWKYTANAIKYYSCGPFGCWAVNNRNYVYFSTVTPSNCRTSGQSRISGSLKMVEVGSDGSVFGVSPAGQVFQRSGVSRRNPRGTRWTRIPMCMSMNHVSYDLGRLWVVSTSGLVMFCTH
ncbi:fish-egg lectin-like [Polymixia lowei]